MQIETVNNKCEKNSSHGRGKMSKQTGHGGKGGRGGPDGELAPPPRTQGTVTWGWIQYSTVPYCQMRCVDVAPSLGEGPWLCRSTSHAQVRASASSSGPAPGTRSTSAHIRRTHDCVLGQQSNHCRLGPYAGPQARAWPSYLSIRKRVKRVV